MWFIFQKKSIYANSSFVITNRLFIFCFKAAIPSIFFGYIFSLVFIFFKFVAWRGFMISLSFAQLLWLGRGSVSLG